MKKPFANPVRHCVITLRSCGLGVKRISRLTRTDPSLVSRWVKKAGFQRMDKKKAGQVGAAAFKKKWIDTGAWKTQGWNVRRCAQVTRSEFAASIKAIKANCIGNDRLAHAAIPREQRLRNNAKKTYQNRKHDLTFLEKKRVSHRNWERLNRDHKREYDANWRERNRGRVRDYTRTQRRKPGPKLVFNLRRRLRDFVKREFRSLKTRQLIGCSPSFLKTWIESQFKRGMRWDNYGTKWHIDHKVPCAAFDLTKKDQQQRCFHYSNLQPLLSRVNMEKSDTIPTNHTEDLTLSL